MNDSVEFYKWSLTIAGENLFYIFKKIKKLNILNRIEFCVFKSQTSAWRNGRWCHLCSPPWGSAFSTCSSSGSDPFTCRTGSLFSSEKPSLCTTSAWCCLTSTSAKRSADLPVSPFESSRTNHIYSGLHKNCFMEVSWYMCKCMWKYILQKKMIPFYSRSPVYR